MNYQDRVVCFLDILGFRGLVAATINANGTEAMDCIEHLIKAFEHINWLLDIDRPEEREGIEITQFSDSVVISFLETEESGVFHSLLKILWVQMGLGSMGILCRGAVTRGKLVHTSKFLFGPGMVDAYVLESKAALYPRVILDESIINLGKKAHASHHGPEHEKESIMNLLGKDLDGMYYIDYIASSQSEWDDDDYYRQYLTTLQQMVDEGLKSKDLSIVVKHRWLQQKLKNC